MNMYKNMCELKMLNSACHIAHRSIFVWDCQNGKAKNALERLNTKININIEHIYIKTCQCKCNWLGTKNADINDCKKKHPDAMNVGLQV